MQHEIFMSKQSPRQDPIATIRPIDCHLSHDPNPSMIEAMELLMNSF